MFRLRDLKNGLYQIHKTNGPAWEGIPQKVFEEAVKMGIQFPELQWAVRRLSMEHCDYADFNKDGKLKAIFRNK